MPIYEYECLECNEVHEISQSISEEPKSTCPACSGPLKKLISMSSFQLKGGGWYSDGYSSKSCDSSGCKTDSAAAAKPSCAAGAGSSCPCS